eukprot:c415_g1_i1.p1 GENE.c415_g1_i1~~c415_g1_i1.p1  ORF type:complete len:171 (+),score=35.75 c415_g1_i1:58-513(+)
MKIMVLVDGSEHSQKALDKAIEFTKDGDVLYVCHACQYPDLMSTTMAPVGGLAPLDPSFLEAQKQFLQKQGDDICQKALKQCKEHHIREAHAFVITTIAAKADACALAQETQVDLIIVGQRGLGALKKLVLGSFSSYVLSHAKCDVLLVKT